MLKDRLQLLRKLVAISRGQIKWSMSPGKFSNLPRFYIMKGKAERLCCFYTQQQTKTTGNILAKYPSQSWHCPHEQGFTNNGVMETSPVISESYWGQEMYGKGDPTWKPWDAIILGCTSETWDTLETPRCWRCQSHELSICKVDMQSRKYSKHR